jgi:bifunctional non-homologous end joining protein LigD
MALRLPSPMLARSGAIPTGGYAFEVKWDGFRALVNRNGDFQVRSRRGWNMTSLLPELCNLPAEAMFDGEIVAFADGQPHFPLVCRRLLHGDRSVPLTYVIFDLLALDGESTMRLPYRERRQLLEELKLRKGPWFVAEMFDDGDALFAAVRQHGIEGVVAKRRSQPYRPGERAWIKTKNKGYWRYREELESMRRSLERRARAHQRSDPPRSSAASTAAHPGHRVTPSPTPS